MGKFDKIDFGKLNKMYRRLLEEDRSKEAIINVGLLRDIIHELKSQQYRMAKIGAERTMLRKAIAKSNTESKEKEE